MKSKYFILIICMTILTSAFVWVRLQIVSISYDIDRLSKKEHLLSEECNNISLKINKEKSPEKLEYLATQKLKMHSPRPEQIVVLRP